MIPAKALETYELLVSVEMRNLDAQVHTSISHTVASAAKHGALGSGRALILVVKDAADSLPVRASIALRLLLRTVAAHGLVMSDELEAEAFARLSDFLREQARRLTNMAVGSAPFRSGLGQAAEQSALHLLTSVTETELDRLRGELALITEAAKRAPVSVAGGPPVLTIHGPVGFVQTGAGSIGTAHQHIDSGARDALEKALVGLSEALSALDRSNVPFDIDDIQDMVRESTEELRKPKPNASKVQALIGGIGSAIAFAPKLKGAYDTLQWAASLLGHML